MWKKYVYFIRRAHWRFWEDVLVASYLCYISDIFIQVQLFKAAFQRGRNSHCGAQRRRLQGEGVKTLPVQSDISADMSISPSFVLACCCPAMLITLLKADCASHLVQWQKPISTKIEADFSLPVCLLCLSEVFSSASSLLCVITTLKDQGQLGLCSTNKASIFLLRLLPQPTCPGVRLDTRACAWIGEDVLGSFQDFSSLLQIFSCTPGSALFLN